MRSLGEDPCALDRGCGARDLQINIKDFGCRRVHGGSAPLSANVSY